MLNPVVSLLVYSFEMLISYLFFSQIAERRFSPVLCWLVGLLCFESAAAANLLSANTVWVNLISFCVVNLSFALLCFRMRLSTAVFHSFILTAIMSALEIVVILITSTLRGSDTTSYNSDVIALVLYITLSKALYFFTCLVLTNFIVKGKSGRKFPLGLYVYPAGVFICLTLFWYIGAEEHLSDMAQYFLATSSVILLGSTVVLFLAYQHGLERENEYMLVKNEFERLQTEKTYYDILEHQNQQLMIYAHDAKNHFACIQNLNTDPRVNEYIEKLSQQLTHYTDRCRSGNQTLDVIISKYAAACELKSIHFQYDVCLCNLSAVDDLDLVAILGNLLDNALTAAEQSLEKEVSIATALRNSYIVIVIENSCDTAPTLSGDRLITTKADSKLHGFGLKSVAKTLKKYQGDFSWDYHSADKRFITTVMLGEKR